MHMIIKYRIRQCILICCLFLLIAKTEASSKKGGFFRPSSWLQKSPTETVETDSTESAILVDSDEDAPGDEVVEVEEEESVASPIPAISFSGFKDLLSSKQFANVALTGTKACVTVFLAKVLWTTVASKIAKADSKVEVEAEPEPVPDLLAESATIEISAGMEDVAPLLFDLLKVQEYHPLLGTAEIVGEQTTGVGAVRRLTYADGETTFLETVTESNEVDHIRLQLSEYPFPCKVMFADIDIAESVDDESGTTATTFTVKIEFEMNEGVPAETMTESIEALGQGMVAGAKELVEKKE